MENIFILKIRESVVNGVTKYEALIFNIEEFKYSWIRIDFPVATTAPQWVIDHFKTRVVAENEIDKIRAHRLNKRVLEPMRTVRVIDSDDGGVIAKVFEPNHHNKVKVFLMNGHQYWHDQLEIQVGEEWFTPRITKYVPRTIEVDIEDEEEKEKARYK